MILPSDPYTTFWDVTRHNSFWDVTRRNWTQLDATPFETQLDAAGRNWMQLDATGCNFFWDATGCNFNIVKIVHFGQKYAVVGITFSFFFKPYCAKCNQPAHICNEQAFSFFL